MSAVRVCRAFPRRVAGAGYCWAASIRVIGQTISSRGGAAVVGSAPINLCTRGLAGGPTAPCDPVLLPPAPPIKTSLVLERMFREELRSGVYRDRNELVARLMGHSRAFIRSLNERTGATVVLNAALDAVDVTAPSEVCASVADEITARIRPAAFLPTAPLRRWLTGGVYTHADSEWVAAVQRAASIQAWSGDKSWSASVVKAPRASEEGGARRLTLRVGSFRRCVALLREISGVDVGETADRRRLAIYGTGGDVERALCLLPRAFVPAITVSVGAEWGRFFGDGAGGPRRYEDAAQLCADIVGPDGTHAAAFAGAAAIVTHDNSTVMFMGGPAAAAAARAAAEERMSRHR